MIENSLYSLVGIVHSDFKIPNLVMQGAHIVPIDSDDYRLRTGYKRRVTQQMVQELIGYVRSTKEGLVKNASKFRLL